MPQEGPTRNFTAEDVDMLVEALSLHEPLLGAAQAARLVERALAYPIRSVSDVRVVFERFGRAKRALTLGHHTVTFEEASRYLPKEGFPIENRAQLLSRILVAFETGRLEHNQAAQTLVQRIKVSSEKETPHASTTI
jgi:hypothetical protein